MPEGIPSWFNEAIGCLLDPRTEFGDLKRSADQLHQRLSQLAGGSDLRGADRTFLTGRAISPYAAAACLSDFMRTTAFLRGVDAALHQARAGTRGRLEVVYAGCGPFAPLLLPFLSRYRHSNVKFTFIDAHMESCLSVRQLIARFGLHASDHLVLYGDAAEHWHRMPIHVAVVETMQRALLNEPQAAITQNLASQLAERGLIVPEDVTVHLARATRGEESGVLAAGEAMPVLTLSRTVAREIPAVFGAGVRVNIQPDSAMRPLALFTSVRTFGEHTIGWNESGITLPLLFHEEELRVARTVHVQYRVAAVPGFILRAVPSGTA